MCGAFYSTEKTNKTKKLFTLAMHDMLNFGEGIVKINIDEQTEFTDKSNLFTLLGLKSKVHQIFFIDSV